MTKLTPEDVAALEPFWAPQALATRPPNPNNLTSLVFVGGNNAGVRVTEETAFQVSVFWACIDVVSKAIASSDWPVYERLSNGDRELLANDSVSYLLNTRPNPEMTAMSFRRALMIGAMSWGNGYAEIVRDMSGRVAELYPICPDRVTPMRDPQTQIMFYRVFNELGEPTDLDARDMFHIRGPSINGIVGDNMISKAARSLALAIAQERFAEAYFGNNTQLGIAIEVPDMKDMDDPSYERLRDSWERRHRGPSKAFSVGFLEGGMKLHQLEVQADKAQLNEARQNQVEEICRWYGVPPHKVQHLLRATFNNIEHLGIEFSRDGLRPWAREMQQEADYKLFPARGKPRFSMIDLAWASQGDFKSRAEGYQIMRNIGAYSANDVLRKEGENTIGPEGDIRIVNGAAVRLEDVGKNMTPTGGTPAAQGDAVRNAYVAMFQSVYERVELRRDNRITDLRRGGCRDMAASLEQFVDQQDGFLRQTLRTPCDAFDVATESETFNSAVSYGRRVANGETIPEDAARALVSTYLRAA